MPLGEASYTFPHRALVETFSADEDGAAEEVWVDEAAVLEALEDVAIPEHDPYFALQPLPQYADELPQYPYWLFGS
jgi:hypothetical protein